MVDVLGGLLDNYGEFRNAANYEHSCAGKSADELAKQCEALEHRARASEERCRSPRLRLTSAPIMND